MFNKIVEFFTGKKPEAAPEAPYKVDAAPAGTETPVTAEPWPFPTVEAAPAPVAAIIPDTVMVTPEAVVPSLVVDTIVTEPIQPVVTAPKSAVKRGATKVTANPKAPTAPKAPRKPRSKKV